MKVAVVILNWNGRKLLEQFLPSVVSFSKGADVYVADNASTDDSVAFLSFVPMDVFGFRMKFTRRLCSLRLISLILSRDHIESLMFGIQTGQYVKCHLTELCIENSWFLHDEAIEELCDGLPKSSALEKLVLEGNHFTDHHIALIFDSLKSHKSLTWLDLSDNECRQEGVEALARFLAIDHATAESNTIRKSRPLRTLILNRQIKPEDSSSSQQRLDFDHLVPTPP